MAISLEMNKSSPINFNLTFPLLPVRGTLAANEEFTLNIHTTVIPGVTLEMLERRWQSTRANATGNMEFQPMNTGFIVDAQFKNWQLLFEWMSYINNNKDKMIEEHSNYGVDSSLIVTDNFQSKILGIRFVDMFPMDLSEVSMSYREGEVILEANITFMFDYYEIVTI